MDTDASVCYGAELLAQVQAPTILGVNSNRWWSFYKQNVDILAQKYSGLKDFFPSDCPDCDSSLEHGLWSTSYKYEIVR
ncbi:hypothetical protein GGI35DRAFT_366937 [Trichoderma velutinum]